MHHLLPGLRSLCGKAETALGKAQRTLYFLTPHPKFPKKPSPNSLFPFSTDYCSVDNEWFLLGTFWLPGGECIVEKGQTLLVSRMLFRAHPPPRGNSIHIRVEFHKESSRRPNLQIQRMLERGVKQDPSYLPLEGTQLTWIRDSQVFNPRGHGYLTLHPHIIFWGRDHAHFSKEARSSEVKWFAQGEKSIKQENWV